MSFEIVSKLVLCLLAAPAVWWLGAEGGAGERGKRRSRRKAHGLLVLVALISGAAYYNYGAFHGTSYIHHWEQFHYFLGSKYFPELGYDGLYAASLAAQQESHPRMTFQAWARDLNDNRVVTAYQVARYGREEVRPRFSDERWASFVADNGWFLDHNSWQYLLRVRKDHGYNPTPAWTFMARLVSGWTSADREVLTALANLDLILIVLLFGFLWRTFGSRVACLCLIVFGLGYPWRFDWIGGGLLRLDWLAAVGIAVCLLKRERYRGAGALLAYAAMVRIFPLALLLGPGVLALRALVRREDGAWGRRGWVVRFAQGFLLVAVLMAVAGGLTGRGFAAWGEFAHNLETHEETWLTNNVGLKNVLLYDVETMQRTRVDFRLPEPWMHWQSHMNELEAERRVPLYALAALYILLAALAAWRARLPSSVLLGLVAVFALTLLTSYYWAVLLLLPVRDGRRGTVVLLLMSAGLYALHLTSAPSFELIYGLMSWAVAILIPLWLGPQAWAALRELHGGLGREAGAGGKAAS